MNDTATIAEGTGNRTDGDIWVFGCGSLMWQPDFPHVETRLALLRGYHRALCIYSTRYRGTPEQPGLVAGLDRGGSCRGRAYRVAANEVEGVLEYLDYREMLTGVYHPKFVPVRLDDGRRVPAYAFIARRDHEQYAGHLTHEEAARLVRQGNGSRGPSREYLENTIGQLADMGIRDSALLRILKAVRAGSD